MFFLESLYPKVKGVLADLVTKLGAMETDCQAMSWVVAKPRTALQFVFLAY